MKTKVMALSAGVLSLALIAPVFADKHDPKEKAIKARQAYMQVIGFNMGGLGAMAKGNVAYDAEQATGMANNVKALASMYTGNFWPEGSDNQAYKGKTRAKPEAWSTYPKVAELHQEFVDASDKLAASAGTGLDGLRSAMGGVGETCKGCHKEFRTRDF
jgi:cytochrome c556